MTRSSAQNRVLAALAASLLALSLAPPGPASAQLISIKSVPVATGDQFLLYPSDNLALGGTSIALGNSLLVLCSQSLFRFADLGDDGLCRGGPDKGCGVIVSAIDVVVDRLD